MQTFHIEDDSMVEAWRQLSHIMSISTLLRGSPYHLKHDKSYFPLDLCKAHGVPPVDSCDVQSEGVKRVVQDMTDNALEMYNDVETLWKKGCVGELKQFKNMILLGSPAVFYLQKLKKKNYNLIGIWL